MLGGGARLHAGATATLEEPSLSGQANRYVSIDPGDPGAQALPAGATIDSGSTESVVEIDELYNLLDERTRASLGNMIRGQRDAFRGRAADADRFYATFAPAVQASDRLFRGRPATASRCDGSSVHGGAGADAAGEQRRPLRDGRAVGRGGRRVRARVGLAVARDRGDAGDVREGRAAFAALRAALPDFGALVAGRGRHSSASRRSRPS